VKEPDGVLLARRNLGKELAAYRRAAGYTQAALAGLTGFSRSTVANVEVGRQHVPRSFCERADSGLRTGGELARSWDDLYAVIEHERKAAARTASRARRSHASHLHSREQLAAHGLPAHAAAGRMPAGASQPKGSRDLARLRSMRLHLKAIDNTHGGQAALAMTEWYLHHEVRPLLGTSSTGAPSRSLLDVVAQFELDAGWMAYDTDDQKRATAHLTTALRLSRAADDRLFGARVLAAMSHQAIHLGQRRQAIEFAQAARAATKLIATPRTTAMLAAMEACGHAAAGDNRHCLQALDNAATALTYTSDTEEPDWLDFDEGAYWGHAARAHRDLGHAANAEEYAAKSVGLCHPAHIRTRAQRTTIQATAWLALGDADAAAAAAEQVVREAWTLHSGRVLGEVAQLADSIAPFRTAAAREFENQAHEFLAARAPTLSRRIGN
jgi:transcriptional regulator with XRE-family HTH domain